MTPAKVSVKVNQTATQASDPRAVEQRIKAAEKWQADILVRMRKLICDADPDVVEEVKWRKPGNGMLGVPTWSHDGLLCTAEPYKEKVKFTFNRGAALPDPAGLFNGNDTGATRRSIDVMKGGDVNAAAFKQLVKAAVEENQR